MILLHFKISGVIFFPLSKSLETLTLKKKNCFQWSFRYSEIRRMWRAHYFYPVSLNTLVLYLLFVSNPLSFYNGVLLGNVLEPHSLECGICVEPWGRLIHPCH